MSMTQDFYIFCITKLKKNNAAPLCSFVDQMTEKFACDLLVMSASLAYIGMILFSPPPPHLYLML